MAAAAATDLSPAAFIDALVGGDRGRCAAIVVDLLAERRSPLELYEDYFTPALYRVGALWEQNRLSVASEHLATSIIEGLMNDVFPSLMSYKRRGETIVVASVEEELHQVGASMACDLFEMHGWDTILLESDTRVEALIDTLHDRQPAMVGLSCTLPYHIATLSRTIDAIHRPFPALPIIVGGHAIDETTTPTLESRPGVYCFRGLRALHRYLTDLARGAA